MERLEDRCLMSAGVSVRGQHLFVKSPVAEIVQLDPDSVSVNGVSYDGVAKIVTRRTRDLSYEGNISINVRGSRDGDVFEINAGAVDIAIGYINGGRGIDRLRTNDTSTLILRSVEIVEICPKPNVNVPHTHPPVDRPPIQPPGQIDRCPNGNNGNDNDHGNHYGWDNGQGRPNNS